MHADALARHTECFLRHISDEKESQSADAVAPRRVGIDDVDDGAKLAGIRAVVDQAHTSDLDETGETHGDEPVSRTGNHRAQATT